MGNFEWHGRQFLGDWGVVQRGRSLREGRRSGHTSRLGVRTERELPNDASNVRTGLDEAFEIGREVLAAV